MNLLQRIWHKETTYCKATVIALLTGIVLSVASHFLNSNQQWASCLAMYDVVVSQMIMLLVLFRLWKSLARRISQL